MRKRSKYRPKGVRLDCMHYVKTGLMPMRQAEKQEVISLTNYTALDALCKGSGTRMDCLSLIHAVNLAEALVINGIGEEYKAQIRAGSDAVQALSKRGIQTNRWIMRGEEMQAIRLMLEIHEAQLDVATVIDIEKANALVVKEVTAGRAINVYKEAVHG